MSINIPQFTLPDLSSFDYRVLDPRTFDWANVDFKLLGTDIIVIGIVLLIVACIYSLIFRVRKAREEIDKITSRGSLEGIYQGSAEQAAAQLQKELYETGDKRRKERDKERKQAEKKAKEAKPEPTAKKEILPRNYNGSASVETEYVQRGFTTLGSESPEESPASMLEDVYSATSILETETPTAILDEGDSSSAIETDEYATSILDDDVSSGDRKSVV